ncbi:MAG: AraC family transcriptional regulator [Labilithrix sp.]|nr:AraC family transcriptional regulator [Labilithrix sp.]MBX3221903.1 AraC family transcriptional regulator [Labilithrix sp.]
MDVLADVLSVTRMGATVIAQAELVPPWGLEVDPIAEAHVHVVQRGTCWLRTSVERQHVHLGAGDVVLIRGGVGHSICDNPKTRPAPYKKVLNAMPHRLASLPKSRAHETTVVLCAKYLFQHVGPHPLTSLLPPLIHLRAHEAERHVQLQLLLQLLRHEAIDAGCGTELVVPRLVDSLLVFVVRAWLEGQPVGAGGWFGALRDPAIAKALSLIHGQPQSSWSVEGLARQVAQSRATFARRFAELVGETPAAYLTRWRMCLATKLLCETDVSLDEVASRVGYETAPAFSKAFRRSHGSAPGRFRSLAREELEARAATSAPVARSMRRTDKT